MTRPACLLLIAALAASAEPTPPRYRTDGGDEKLPWFVPEATDFPPADTAHSQIVYLVRTDPAERTGTWMATEIKPIPFAMLPYGSIRYRGADATMWDLPPGIRLHAEVYQDRDRNRFNRALRLSDDFSRQADRGRAWKVVEIRKGESRFWVVDSGDTSEPARRTEVRYDGQTRWWKDSGIGTASDLAVGQMVQMNFAPLVQSDPPVHLRAGAVWLDARSQALAAQLQQEDYRTHVKTRGLPARVDTVDNAANRFTATLLASGDATLASDLKADRAIYVAVAELSLRTFEPGGGQGGPDIVGAKLTRIEDVPALPGSGGRRLSIRAPFLLEGFRPGRVVRVFPEGWPHPVLWQGERIPK